MTKALGNDDMVPCTSFFSVMPDLLIVMPNPDRASQIAGQAGNDDMVPCTSFSSVMPDPDRASLPLQIAGQEIAGQAGNDEKVSCTSFFFVMPDPDRASTNVNCQKQ